MVSVSLGKEDGIAMTFRADMFNSVRDSQATRIAMLIARDIAEGRLLPGSKLRSERDLASAFHVSQKVIFNAKNFLEAKHLITRIPRKGVFVARPEADERTREILIFAMDRDPGKNPFVRDMLGIVRSSYTQAKLNFNVRLVSIGNHSWGGNVERELHLLESLTYIDCAIILTLGFLRRDIEYALSLPYPVIFAGDFFEGDYDDLNYLRVGPTTYDSNLCAVNYACKQGYRRIVYLFPKQIYEYYILNYFQEFSQLAAEHGMETIPLLVSHTDVSNRDEEVKKSLISNRKLLESSDFLVSRYFKLPNPGFDLPDTCYLAEMEETKEKFIHNYFDKLYLELCELIFHINEYKNIRKIVQVPVGATIVEPK